MLKKSLIVTLLSLVVSTAYADAPVTISVKGNLDNQFFSLDATQWGYQFNNGTGQIMTFVATVEKSSKGAITLQCWHGQNPVESSRIEPGQTSNPCITDDEIRIVTADDNKNLPATGTYTITLGSK